MTRTVRWTTRALKDLRRIDPPAARRVADAIDKYAASGEGNIRRLLGVTPPLFRMRIGDLRVLFRQDENEEIDIERVLPATRLTADEPESGPMRSSSETAAKESGPMELDSGHMNLLLLRRTNQDDRLQRESPLYAKSRSPTAMQNYLHLPDLF